MLDDTHLQAAIRMEVENRGGFVTVDGRRMVRVEVVRAAVKNVLARFFSVARQRLPDVLAGDPLTENQLLADLAESAKHLEKAAAGSLPPDH